MPDDDQIGPGFGRDTGDFPDRLADLHADLGHQPHGGKSMMALVKDRLEIGLLVGKHAGIRTLRQRIARDRLDHGQQNHPCTRDLRKLRSLAVALPFNLRRDAFGDNFCP